MALLAKSILNWFIHVVALAEVGAVNVFEVGFSQLGHSNAVPGAGAPFTSGDTMYKG
jgi:hypothetical protein